jgi:homoserine kinase
MASSISAVAYAPGGIGNLGPGLDILGCALEGAGDTVSATWSDSPGIVVAEPGDPTLPRDPDRNAAALAAGAVLARAAALGIRAEAPGLVLRVTKGLAIAAGQGGSAASAVAGAVATNALLGGPLDRQELLAAALVSEERLAGRHLDNIAPALLGGIVLIRSMEPIETIALPVPESLFFALATPRYQLQTARARAALPTDVPLATALHQAAQVATIVAACYCGDVTLLGRAMEDRIAEPVRAPLLPGFTDAKKAALQAGALGASISGAGPTAFAVCDSETTAADVAAAMARAYRASGWECVHRVARPDRIGARLLKEAAP